MGEVYLAEDTRLKRKVALKFLPEHFSRDPEARARFQREAEALATLNHPDIVAVFDVSEHDGRPYIVMEYCEGQSVKELIAAGDIDVDRALDIVTQIGEGLAAAHDERVIHRDIKSDNVVVTTKGRVKIMDFGLATWRGVTQLTKEGSTVGTMAYMSPEQAQGKPVDQRTDLWSLGVILYELLTRHLPFGGEHEAAIAYSIINDTPEPLARYKSGFADDLQRIINNALDKDPETRYQTATGFLADLKKLRQTSASAVSLPAAVPPETTRPRGRRGMAISAAVVAVAAVLLLVFKPWKIEVQPTHEAAAQENRLAVMYFDNLADPDDPQKLGEITTHLLIADLSESQYVNVVSSQRLYDVLKLLGREGVKEIDREVATQVAERAQARWMMLGSILQVEPEIILTAQLVEVSSGNVLASQRVTGARGERIFSLVDKLTVGIKSDLSLPAAALDEADPEVSDITSPSTEAYAHYLEGMEYFYQYLFDDAEASFHRALEIDSTLAMAYYGISLLRTVEASERGEAIANAVRYIDHASSLEQRYIRARDAVYAEDFNRAVAELEGIVADYPDEKEACFRLARLYQTRDATKTLEMLLRAIEIDPMFKEPYNVLAYGSFVNGDLERSVWAMNKYAELAPNEPNPYDTRGDLYAWDGKIDEAIASYERAVEINPAFVSSIEHLGEMYLFKRDYVTAERYFQSLASDPDKTARAVGRRMLAYIPLYQGHFREALRRIDVYIETNRIELGESPELAMGLLFSTEILAELGDVEAAITRAQEAYRIIRDTDPQYEYAPILVGTVVRLYEANGDSAAATRAILEMEDRLTQTDSAYAGFYWLTRGWREYERGDYDDATAALEHCRESGGYGFVPELWAARSHFAAGHLADAVTGFERSLRWYDPPRAFYGITSVKLHYWLGQAYEQSGWNDKAIEQYETFLDMWQNADPGIAEIDDARARLARLRSGTS